MPKLALVPSVLRVAEEKLNEESSLTAKTIAEFTGAVKGPDEGCKSLPR